MRRRDRPAQPLDGEVEGEPGLREHERRRARRRAGRERRELFRRQARREGRAARGDDLRADLAAGVGGGVDVEVEVAREELTHHLVGQRLGVGGGPHAVGGVALEVAGDGADHAPVGSDGRVVEVRRRDRPAEAVHGDVEREAVAREAHRGGAGGVARHVGGLLGRRERSREVIAAVERDLAPDLAGRVGGGVDVEVEVAREELAHHFAGERLAVVRCPHAVGGGAVEVVRDRSHDGAFGSGGRVVEVRRRDRPAQPLDRHVEDEAGVGEGEARRAGGVARHVGKLLFGVERGGEAPPAVREDLPAYLAAGVGGRVEVEVKLAPEQRRRRVGGQRLGVVRGPQAEGGVPVEVVRDRAHDGAVGAHQRVVEVRRRDVAGEAVHGEEEEDARVGRLKRSRAGGVARHVGGLLFGCEESREARARSGKELRADLTGGVGGGVDVEVEVAREELAYEVVGQRLGVGARPQAARGRAVEVVRDRAHDAAVGSGPSVVEVGRRDVAAEAVHGDEEAHALVGEGQRRRAGGVARHVEGLLRRRKGPRHKRLRADDLRDEQEQKQQGEACVSMAHEGYPPLVKGSGKKAV